MEKNAQVAIMADIFRLSARVLIWLGPSEHPDTDLAATAAIGACFSMNNQSSPSSSPIHSLEEIQRFLENEHSPHARTVESNLALRGVARLAQNFERKPVVSTLVGRTGIWRPIVQ